MPLSRKSPSPSPPAIKQTDGDGKARNSAHVTKGPSLHQPHLTRQRKLRYLPDQDVGLHSDSPHASSLPASPLSSSASKSRSPAPGAGAGGYDHWSSFAVAQPLPLPEWPLTNGAKSTSPNSGSPPLNHPGFAFLRKTVDHDPMTNIKSSSNLGRSSLDSTVANANYDLGVNIPAASFLAGDFSTLVAPQELNIGDLFPSYVAVSAGNNSSKDSRAPSHNNVSENISNSRLHVAAKSAPTSVFSSPVTSPRRSSNVDFFNPSINFPQDFNDILEVLPAKTVLSPDHSPLRTPGSQSPYLNPKIKNGFQPHNFFSRVWPENNHVDAHPLPLPPGASSPAQSSSSQHQSSIAHHTAENSPSMKGQWHKGKCIGRGTFGTVYHATNLETGASCAMKEVDLIPDDPKYADSIKQLEKEIRILRQLQHPNIVQYYGSEIVGDYFYIYMEYIHPGSISKFVHERCGAMTESVVRNFTRHILSGLAYLHSTKTIHRDIKGANLLVDASGVVKLADFGLAKILTGKPHELSLKGSPYWMAPELMKAAMMNESNPDLATAIDIWSLGCTIIEMMTGKPPWSEFESAQAMFQVLHKSPPIPETLSSEGQDFLRQCFTRNPAERPSAARLLMHSFVQNLQDQNILVHPQAHPRGEPGPEDNSCSPRYSSKNSLQVVPASIGARIFNKIKNLIGDTSRKCNTEESNHRASPTHQSPCSVSEANIRKSPLKPSTLNYVSVANSRNILLTFKRVIRHF